MDISVIIPTYKNTDLFLKNLKHNLEHLKGCEVIVVNDNPKESLKEHLKQYTEVILIENMKNLGFGPTVNRGIAQVTKRYVMLLNSDVLLFDDSYTKALHHFRDPQMFAVSFAQKEKDGEIVGKNKIYWHKGFFQHCKESPLTTGINGWAEGGSAIFDKDKLNKLDGFDPLYSPFYWEDIDLSYRAWKKGYKILFDEHIVVEHHHESTIGTYFDKNHIQMIAYRNQFIFMWKNTTDISFIASHKFHLTKRLLKAAMNHDKVFLKGFSEALKRLPTIIKKRVSLSHSRSDHEVLSQFN